MCSKTTVGCNYEKTNSTITQTTIALLFLYPRTTMSSTDVETPVQTQCRLRQAVLLPIYWQIVHDALAAHWLSKYLTPLRTAPPVYVALNWLAEIEPTKNPNQVIIKEFFTTIPENRMQLIYWAVDVFAEEVDENRIKSIRFSLALDHARIIYTPRKRGLLLYAPIVKSA